MTVPAVRDPVWIETIKISTHGLHLTHSTHATIKPLPNRAFLSMNEKQLEGKNVEIFKCKFGLTEEIDSKNFVFYHGCGGMLIIKY